MPSTKSVVAGGALAALTAGCASLHVMSHVPVSTMSRLSSMTLVEIDTDRLRVAARLPASLEPRPQGVKVKIDLKDGRGRSRSEEFVLEETTEPDEQAVVSAHRRPGTRISIFRLSTADAGRLRRIQTEAFGPSAATSVTIAAGVDACRRSPLGSSPLPTTTLLRINASDYFVLAEDLDLRSIVSEADLAAKVPPCAH